MESGIMSNSERQAKRDGAGYFTFPWMNEADICRVPAWAERTVWYQIFPARFCRGTSDTAPETLKKWADPDEKVENGDIFGGNLQGIIDKFDYLSSLGIGGIYLTPVNTSPSQHKYDTTDYLTIDPSFATKRMHIQSKSCWTAFLIIRDRIFLRGKMCLKIVKNRNLPRGF